MAAQMFDYGPERTSGRHPSEANWSAYSENINQRMRVPERIRVAPGQSAEEEQRSEEVHPAYSMQIPDKLAWTDVPDLSARPQFSKQVHGHSSSLWDLHQGAFSSEAAAALQHPAQSPIRRSYSDHAFGRSPPLTPTRTKESLQSPSSFGHPDNPSRCSAEVQPYTETRRSALQESWLSPDEESGAAVEFIVLRRQLLKMSRRLAALERQNMEHKQAEMLLFSLMVSAVLLNGWLWMRR
ncbi:mitochondrial fission factor-like isoform X2 [Clupea harengus]|uniref:Mitochondrial fission factor n=1 Tax=Clupea harengus TaxID=7950 RepID=A0A6P8FJJ6_CLUHA|nr:mitochondrial fission factor-like isoform X2 [Clupea harengus]